MADSDDTTTPNPGGEPDRESVSGRYVSRHDSAKDGDGEKKEENGKKRWLLLLLLLLILLLLLCAGFAYMKWWKKDTGNPQPSTSPTVAVTTEAPKPSPTPSASPSPSPSPKTAAMPNVVGKPAAEAKTILEAAGFSNYKFVADGKPGEALSLLDSYVVTAQSVPAGTQVPLDGAITLTCKTSSNGKG